MKVRKNAEKYKAQSVHYLENAFVSLEVGEVEKASEFLWGSMAQAIKAVAAFKGEKLRSHRDIWEYASELAKDLSDPQIFNAFSHAHSLHSNFYEAGLTREIVQIYGGEIRAAVARLINLMSIDKRPGSST